MKEQYIEIPTAAGKMGTFVTHPSQDGPFPAIILYMDVWGVREVLNDLARRVATVGYYVMVPDFYYRQGKIRTDYRDADGRAISLSKLDAKAREQVLAPQKALTDAMVVQDTGAILEFLRTQKDVKPGAVGAFGYCMGGRHAVQAATAYPDRFKAVASLHGTTLITKAPDSAHVGLAKLQGELYCGFAEIDEYAPLSLVEEWNALLKSCRVTYRHEYHKGAIHGYALPDRDIYQKEGAERDWEMMFAMFHRQMPAYAK
jgi:carboxymethylenebutenolidase